MKSQRAVIPVMVNGTLEGLEPHACSGEKRNGLHTGCYGEIGEGGSPLLVGDCKGKSRKTHSGFLNLLPEAEYSTCLSDWCRDVTESGRGCKGKGITGYDITLNKTLESSTLASGHLTQALHP